MVVSSPWIRGRLRLNCTRCTLHAVFVPVPYVLADIVSTGCAGREVGYLLARQLGADYDILLSVNPVLSVWSDHSRLRRDWTWLLSAQRTSDTNLRHLRGGSGDHFRLTERGAASTSPRNEQNERTSMFSLTLSFTSPSDSELSLFLVIRSL